MGLGAWSKLLDQLRQLLKAAAAEANPNLRLIIHPCHTCCCGCLCWLHGCSCRVVNRSGIPKHPVTVHPIAVHVTGRQGLLVGWERVTQQLLLRLPLLPFLLLLLLLRGPAQQSSHSCSTAATQVSTGYLLQQRLLLLLLVVVIMQPILTSLPPVLLQQLLSSIRQPPPLLLLLLLLLPPTLLPTPLLLRVRLCFLWHPLPLVLIHLLAHLLLAPQLIVRIHTPAAAAGGCNRHVHPGPCTLHVPLLLLLGRLVPSRCVLLHPASAPPEPAWVLLRVLLIHPITSWDIHITAAAAAAGSAEGGLLQGSCHMLLLLLQVFLILPLLP
jgi:hypothetical protein